MLLLAATKFVGGAVSSPGVTMAEIPSNAILCKEFIREVDGFSIGSNDMTQMVLATDRDNPRLQHIYDEEDPAVVWTILATIFAGQKYCKKVGFCGQGVSNSEILRGLVAIAGIDSASVVPDTYRKTKLQMAEVEALNIPVSKLGDWLREQHFNRLEILLEENGYGHILKRYKTAEDLMEWYEGELDRFSEQLRENIENPKEAFYRQEMERFRAIFHKPVIYSSWDWTFTVEDAMHLGQHQRAVDDINEAVRIRPGDADNYYLRGVALRALGKYDQALEDTNRAIGIEPDNAGAYANRAFIYKAQGNVNQAKADARRARELDPGVKVPSF